MANEASIRCSMIINQGNLRYQSYPTEFRADVAAGGVGPTPGSFLAALAGTRVDLDELTRPGGLCIIKNLDEANYVIVGIFDGVEFYPMLELLPGEFYPCRLSRELGRSVGTGVPGTGAYDAGSYSLMVKATVAPCIVSVEAFDK